MKVALRSSRAPSRGRRALLVAALLASATTWTTLSATPAQEEAHYSNELIALTNLDRTSNGLPALGIDRQLMVLAEERSQDMIVRDYFSHAIPPDGKTVFDLMAQRGITYRAAGENLEFNTAREAQTVRYAQQDFMNSPGHRALILGPDFDRLGAGVAMGNGQRTMYTVLFLGLSEGRAEDRLTPMMAGADAPTLKPAPPRVVVATPTPRAAQAGEGAPGVGRLRPAGAQPLGLIEELINRTLRLYLGL